MRSGRVVRSLVGLLVLALLVSVGQGSLVGVRAFAADGPPGLPGGVVLSLPGGASGAAVESGYLPGGLKVSSSGESTYDVPLDVPAGRAGMQPALGLHYGSRSGNGVMGVSWSVSGVSGITRCGKTVGSEGRATGVKYSAADSAAGDADRFCLDGQKLVAIHGAYGASDTEYRNENESFTKVFSRASDASGPGWFEVWTKDGRRREYRPQTAPRLAAAASSYVEHGEVRFTYPMTRETDGSGNAVEYSYTNTLVEFAGSGTARAVELLLDRVSWSPAGGGQWRRYVKFVYGKGRPDPSFSWQSGVRVEQPQLLTRVEMYGPNPSATQLLWKYMLSYEHPWKRSRMTSVTRCGALGGCTLAKTFKYSGGELTFPSTVVEPAFRLDQYDWFGWTIVTGKPTPIQAADYNGDGADDLLYNFGGARGMVVRMSGLACDDPGCPQTKIAPLQDGHDVTGVFGGAVLSASRPADLDGDGVPELYEGSDSVDVYGNPTDEGHARIGHWDQATQRFVEGGSNGFTLPSGQYDGDDFADFNGDGRIDTLHRDVNLDLHLNQGAGFATAGIHTSGVDTPFNKPYSLIDVNGDGRAELVSPKALEGGTTGRVFGLRDDGTAYEESFTDSRYPMRWENNVAAPTDDEIQYGDFNGDGLADALVARYFPEGEGTPQPAFYIRTNTGNGFGPEELFTTIPRWITTTNIKPDNGLRIADMDGDGRSDVVMFHGQSHGMPTGAWRGGTADFVGATILLAKGGFLEVHGPSPAYSSWAFARIGDFNGDGRPDLVSLQGDTGGDDAATTELRLYENLKDPASVGQGTDLLTEVSDSPAEWTSAAKWPREKVTYSTNWSDQNHTYSGKPVTFPTERVRAPGMMVVRKVESWNSIADPAAAADIADRADVMEYSYENPVMDVQGRGFLGFDRQTVWDRQAQTETVTTFDNTHRVNVNGQPGHWYSLAGLPKSVRVAVPVRTLPMKQSGDVANVRVRETRYLYDEVTLNGNTTHYTRPRNADLSTTSTDGISWSTVTQEWEQAGKYDADLSASGNARPRTHLYGLRSSAEWPPKYFRMTWTAETRDEYANVTLSASQVAGADGTVDGGMSRTETQYDYGAARIDAWQLSVPKKFTVTRSEQATAPAGELTSKHTVDFQYDDKARLLNEWTEKDSTDADLRKTTTISYGDDTDGGGEVTSVLEKADTPGTLGRQTFSLYTPPAGGPDEKIYPTQVWSAHSVAAYRPSTWTVWHPGYGVAVKSVDSNGATSTVKHDDLGRVIEQTPPGESAITTTYAPRTDSYGGVNGTVVTVTRGTEETKTFTDNAGRTIRAQTRLDARSVATDTRYDLFGRATAVSRPYLATGGASATQWITTGYDSLGRPTVVTSPDGTYSRNEYPTVFKAEHYDENNNQSYTVTDLTGRTITSATIDGSGAAVSVTSKHGPNGVLEVKDPKNTTTLTYDAAGRLSQAVDANTGTTKTKYNSFGEVRENENDTTASGGRQVLTVDDLGRTTDVADYHGTAVLGHTTTVWDTATNGIGQPATSTSRDGVITSYRYDTNGRPAGTDTSDTTTTLAACSTAHTCSTDLTYTTAGRVDTVSYPAVAGRSDRYTVRNIYYAGHLVEVDDNHGPDGAYRPLWQTTEANPDGNILYGRYGAAGAGVIAAREYEPLTGRLKKATDTNSVGTRLTETALEYFDNGQIKRNNDTVANRDQTYTYDKLSRLTDWTLTTPAPAAARTTHYDYDSSGNLTTTKLNGAVTETNTYTDTAHPSAVTSRTADGTTTNYGYDAQGRQTSRGATTTSNPLTYQGLSLTPATITQGATTTTLTYDADGTRYKKTTGTTSTTYIGGLYEKRVTPAGTSHVFHVAGPPGNIAQITYTGTTTTTEYTLTNPQGTTTTVTNNTGTSPQRQYFDPYGRRTNPNGTTTSPTPTPPTGITRGYTGHETDDDTGLINMKGRLYDPTLKRVTTPDPHITNPNNPQNWNPYSYVNNNPTNNTDPTGNDPLSGSDWDNWGNNGTYPTYPTTTDGPGPQTIQFDTTLLTKPTPTSISDNTTFGQTATDAPTAQEIAADGERINAELYARSSLEKAFDAVAEWYREPITVQHVTHEGVSDYPAATLAERTANATKTWTTTQPRGASLMSAILGAALPMITSGTAGTRDRPPPRGLKEAVGALKAPGIGAEKAYELAKKLTAISAEDLVWRAEMSVTSEGDYVFAGDTRVIVIRRSDGVSFIGKPDGAVKINKFGTIHIDFAKLKRIE